MRIRGFPLLAALVVLGAACSSTSFVAEGLDSGGTSSSGGSSSGSASGSAPDGSALGPDASAQGIIDGNTDGGFPCTATQACVGYPAFLDWVCLEVCSGPDGGECPSGQTCESVSGCCSGGGCSAASHQVCVPSSVTDGGADAPNDSGAFGACAAGCAGGKMCCPGGASGSFVCVQPADGGCPRLP